MRNEELARLDLSGGDVVVHDTVHVLVRRCLTIADEAEGRERRQRMSSGGKGSRGDLPDTTLHKRADVQVIGVSCVAESVVVSARSRQEGEANTHTPVMPTRPKPMVLSLRTSSLSALVTD